MAQQVVNPDGEVVLGEEIQHVRLITLNQPKYLNVITTKTVILLAEYLEKWEKDDEAKLIIIKVALVHGISLGEGASLIVPMKFSVVTEKTVFATPEASIGFHVDCGFSYMLSHLPGHFGEFLALTGARLNGKELVAAGLATHFVPFEKLGELEKRLISLNSGDENSVRCAIQEFSLEVQMDEDSFLKKKSLIDKCFSKETVIDIVKSFEAEASGEGNGWIVPLLKGLKGSSPTGLKIILKSIRKGRKQTLQECLKKEFRLTMNILRTTISGDFYEGIRALTIDKDNAPKWNPSSLEKVDDEKVNEVFQPFREDLKFHLPKNEENRWSGKYEDSNYATLKVERAIKYNLLSKLLCSN